MRIENTNRTAGLGRTGTAGRSGSGVDFVPAGAGAPARASAAAPAMAVGGIDSILALQAIDTATEARRKAAKRGHSLLDELEDFKADLLIGRVGAGRLDRMAAILEQMRERSEPGLDAVLDDIELRVQVELAKLGRYPS